MKGMFEKTFILNFDKSASIYKEEEKLEGLGQGGGMDVFNDWRWRKYIKCKKNCDKNLWGRVLVKDSLVNYQWKLEGETRVIGGYNCFKATTVRPASKTDFRNFRPKKEDPAAANR
jgi:GLPGLI family protein